ncbi:MAG: CheR family methyltransferase [Polyangiaceae bacterium]
MSEQAEENERDTEELEALLTYLNRARGFDFSGYKRTSLSRRLLKRMQTVNVDSYGAYLDYLEVHPDEFPLLFNMLLINVTGFYRDETAWEALGAHIKRLIERRSAGPPIRVWSAGCASGEEPFTLAMIFAELLGAEPLVNHVKIYATDLDDQALSQARQAVYPAKAIEPVPEALRDKYFSRVGPSYAFNKELRRAVIFGRHDLAQDAPISRVDLLSCRNTLMYFNGETQTRILNRLHFALAEEGILFLGKAEMLLTHANLFSPIDLKLRIFARATRPTASNSKSTGSDSNGVATASQLSEKAKLAQSAFEIMPFAQLVIDASSKLVLINGRAATMFSLNARDIGRSFHELELSYRPIELRSSIDQARAERRTIHLRDVERLLPSGEKAYLDVQVSPVIADNGIVGVTLVFNDVTPFHLLQHELRRTNIELEASHEELQSTSEELETTNEELQSTVEELETTNEELQSTNEELETMNEELQSTNEELQTINEELRQRGSELNEVNGFFGSILSSLTTGVVVLDSELLIKAWNPKMEDLFGLRSAEVERKHFLNLDVGLPLETLGVHIRSSLTKGEAMLRTVDCTNRRGRSITCKVSASPLRGPENQGVILLFEETAAAS